LKTGLGGDARGRPLRRRAIGALGPLLETLVLHELRAAVNCQNLGGTFSYRRTPSGSEVDFVWERGNKRIGIGVKAAKEWRREFGSTIVDLRAEGKLTAAYAVYGGKDRLEDRGLAVLPFVEFARELTAGHVLG
jgi:predicted AAA+ superfamily ATPase